MDNILCFLQYQLNEGLIKTYPILKLIDSLKNTLTPITNKDNKHIRFEIQDGLLILNFSKIQEYISIGLINYVISDIYKHGYYISKYVVKNKSNMVNYFKFDFKYDIKQKKYTETDNTFDQSSKLYDKIKTHKELQLIIEPKFDISFNLNTDVYHLCRLKNKLKISKIGLIPKCKNYLVYYPERIHVSSDLYYLESNIIKFAYFGSQTICTEFTIFKIDHTKIKNIKFYNDLQSDGFYTYENIPPDALIFLKDVTIP